MAELRLSNSKEFSGEEEPHVASPESAEACKQIDELQACQGSRPTADADSPTPSSPDSTGETPLLVSSPPASLTPLEAEDRNYGIELQERWQSAFLWV